MSPVELIALSLGASTAVAVVAGLAATGFERVCLGRPHAPYIVTAKAIMTKLRMLPATGAHAAREDARQLAIRSAQAAAAAARATLTPAQRARADMARSAEGFKAVCSGRDGVEVGLCEGVFIGAAARNIHANICLPSDNSPDHMIRRATADLAAEAAHQGEGALELATRVIAKPYPCSRPQ